MKLSEVKANREVQVISLNSVNHGRKGYIDKAPTTSKLNSYGYGSTRMVRVKFRTDDPVVLFSPANLKLLDSTPDKSTQDQTMSKTAVNTDIEYRILLAFNKVELENMPTTTADDVVHRAVSNCLTSSDFSDYLIGIVPINTGKKIPIEIQMHDYLNSEDNKNRSERFLEILDENHGFSDYIFALVSPRGDVSVFEEEPRIVSRERMSQNEFSVQYRTAISPTKNPYSEKIDLENEVGNTLQPISAVVDEPGPISKYISKSALHKLSNE